MSPTRLRSRLAAGAAALPLAAAFLVLPASALAGPADQPPFGGEEIPTLAAPASPDAPPPGFALSAARAIAIADGTAQVREQRDDRGELTPTAATRGAERWEVRYRDEGGTVRALVVIDDGSGEVVEAWTGAQIETKLARGYEDAVAGDLNEWWFWLPLCLAFFAPFFDPRRPLRLLHLDLLVLLGFSASLFFFNKGEIAVSSLLVYPPLLYLLARALIAGFRPRESAERLVPLAPRGLLVAGIAALVALHAWFAVEEAKVIDVGVAGVVGADRLADGEDIYGEEFAAELPESGDVRGDVYGPVNYLAYVPAEAAWPWEDRWDDVPAARYSSLAFSLLTALALFALGRQLREGEEGATLGVALAFAWLAYPFTLYTLGSSFNDSLVALTIVACLLVLSSAPARGAMAALSGLTKFGSLALAPLLAAGTGERRPRSLVAFALAFAAAAALVTVPLLPDGGLRELYDRSLGYQASRGSPFSVWGQAPSLEPLQTLVKLGAVGLALAVFFVPRRRSAVQVAALGAAVVIAVQLTANHWFYPYAVWFAPLFLAGAFAAHRGPAAR
ncbi:MAG: hypothetical protein ACXWF9_12000 [Solirubrobacterales bacterium]